MKKHLIRRAAALTAVTAMLLFCASPVLAADSEAQILEVDLEGFAIHRGASLSGPEVDENGILHIERGKSYDFTYQATVTVGNPVLAGYDAGDYLDTAFRYARTKGFSEPMHETWLLLENDGDYLTFARPVPDSEISLQAEFTNVRLSEDARILEPRCGMLSPIWKEPFRHKPSALWMRWRACRCLTRKRLMELGCSRTGSRPRITPNR